MKAVYALLIALLFALGALAQPPDSLWSRTFGGSGGDYCQSVQQTADGGYILAGETSSFGAGGFDFYFVKTNANGNAVWNKTFGGGAADECRSVRQTTDGGYILAGTTRSFGAGWYDFWLVKTNPNGDSLWSRTFGGSYDEACYAIQQTTDGGYILAGSTNSFGAWYDNFWLVKTDANGDILWSRAYGGDNAETCYSLEQTSDGGYILAGTTTTFGAGLSDFWLVKTNADGDSLWSRTFGGGDQDVCYSVHQTSDGGYILAGETYSFGAGQFDCWLVKTNANGDSVWSRTFGGPNADRCYSMQITSDGGYILAGSTYSFGHGSGDFWLVKTSPNGDSLWSRTFGGSYDDGCYSVQQTADEGYILGGYTWSYGVGYGDFYLVKTGPQAAAEPVIVSLPAEYALYSNWPNPFNPVTQIAYDLSKTGHVTLTIFDLLGREVATLANGMQPAGSHAIIFDGSGLASGIYLYRLQTDGWSQTRKMVLVK